MSSENKLKVAFIHPNLGIGGAERLVVDAAVGLQKLGHKVVIYTMHHDEQHCFKETIDGTLEVRVRGNSTFPSHLNWFGDGSRFKFHILFTTLRALHLTFAFLWENRLTDREEPVTRAPATSKINKSSNSNKSNKSDKINHNVNKADINDNDVYENLEHINDFDIVFVDQITCPIPLLKIKNFKVFFYCHFPDKLLTQGHQQNQQQQVSRSAIKTTLSFAISVFYKVYRTVFDLLEELCLCEADFVAVNSKFTQGVVMSQFTKFIAFNPKVLYPGIDFSKYKNYKSIKLGDSRDTNYQIGSLSRIINSLEDENSSDAATGEANVILSINRFEKKKNLELAVLSFSHLLKTIGNDRDRDNKDNNDSKKYLLIVAGGYDPQNTENIEYLSTLQSLCKDNNLRYTTILSEPKTENIADGKIRGHEASSNIDVAFVLSFSDITRNYLYSVSKVLLYTPHNEHFGIVPIESMYMNVPVVAVCSGGPKETIKDNKTGVLVPPSDANPQYVASVLASLFDSRHHNSSLPPISELAANGHGYVQSRFSMDAFSSNLSTLLTSLVFNPDSTSNSSAIPLALPVLVLLSVFLMLILGFTIDYFFYVPATTTIANLM